MAAINKEKILKSAQKFVASGRLENAIKEYEKILEQEPNDTTTLNTIGDLNLSLNRVQTAVGYFKRAAQQYIDQGFYGRGLAVYRKIVRSDPRNMENAEMLADLFFKEGILSDAKKLYADIGRTFLQANNFTKAYQVFKKLADLTQDDPNIHLKLAELSIKLSMMENARESYLNAAMICSRKGDFQQGSNAIRMALEIDPCNMGSLKILFKISLELREFQLLTEYLSQALKKSPGNRELQEMLGQSCMFQGDLKQAFQIFDELLRSDESKYFLMNDLAEFALRQGDADMAMEAISKISSILLNRRENQKLIDFFNSILVKNPNHVGTLLKLAEVYYKVSDNFKYVETLDKVVEASMRQKNYKESLNVLEKLLNMDSGNEKYRRYHREAFEKVYPNEAYTPIGPVEEEIEDLSGSVFDFDTTELASGRAFDGAKDSDSTLEVELLLSYGLKDKAKSKLLERIKEDPNDIVFRQKLKDIYKEEGNLKQAADLCFELVNLLTLKGEQDRATGFMEEGKGLDPSRSDITIPTGLLKSGFTLPEEVDISSTGIDLLDIENASIDLTDDLSDILVGMDTAEDNHPGATAPQSGLGRSPKPEPKPEPEPEPELEPELELKLDYPVEEEPEPNLEFPAEVEPEPSIPETVEAGAPPAGDAAAPQQEMDSDINLRLEETLKSLEDLGFSSLFDIPGFSRPAAPAKPAPEEEPTPEHMPEPALIEFVEPVLPDEPEPISPPSPPAAKKTAEPVIDKELQTALQEIDFYIKLGFEDNAREELIKLQKKHPTHPEILSRLETVAPQPAAEEVSVSPVREEEIFPTPTIEIQEIAKPEPRETASTLSKEEPELIDIAPEDVNIDLFNFISADSVREETGRPSSSYEVRKNLPQVGEPEVAMPAPAEAEAAPDLFGDLEPEAILENSMLFGEEKTSTQLPSQGLFLPKDTEEEPSSAKSQGKDEALDQNLSAMHNIFADIVEEANKVIISNVEEGDQDFDTHYNLGIAYKEMGLIDDAIGEFQKAYNIVKDDSRSPSFLKSCHILSLCFMDKGLCKSAIKWCERAIHSPGHEDHEYQAIRYDMARAYETLDESKKALDVYTEIFETDVSYRDVSNKIKELRAKIG